MTSRMEDRLTGALAGWVASTSRRPRATAALLLAATGLLLPWTAANLGVNSDHLRLLSERLPFRQRFDELARLFPTTTNALLVLVEAPEAARAVEISQHLAMRLAADREHVRDVVLPGSGPFWERAGLLYRSVEEIEDLADGLARVQPLLASLERSPTLETLALVLDHGLRSSAADAWTPFLDRLGEATRQVFDPPFAALSWADLLLHGSAFEPPRRQVLVVEPNLDYASPLPAGAAIRAIRRVARELGAGEGARVRITGNPALNDEEMRGLAWDVGVSSLASLAVVVALLQLALGSARLVIAAVVTLAVGLVCTGAFAAASVHDLNVISVSFAVLFIGLGIDFAIHLLLHYRELRQGGAPGTVALDAAVRRVGTSLVLCGLTTAIGFYSFLFTAYVGVAELGLIAGTGMLVILGLTLTLLPALLGAGLAPRVPGPGRVHPPARTAAISRRRAGLTCAAFAALAAASLVAVPLPVFDADVVRLRDPGTESVQAFEDLLAESGAASPWHADLVAPDLATADAWAERLRRLPEVAEAHTVSDLVPAQQEEKRAILADAALLLAPQPARDEVEAARVEDPSAALRRLDEALERAEPPAAGRIAASIGLLHEALDRFRQRAERDGDPDAEIRALEEILFGELDHQLARLRLALEPAPVAIADLPPELARRMLAAGGEARVQIAPRRNLEDRDALVGFVDAVLAEAPSATGPAVNLVEFGRETARALREALLTAIVAVALLVWLLWRRAGDALCALAPLAMGGALTFGGMGILGLTFNFANAIVLPLLLGIGVDSGIHIVHRWRAGVGADPTASRAVVYSALTTIASFGSLAFSSHRGIASLGLLLVVGMALVLACNLVFLPALLALRRQP